MTACPTSTIDYYVWLMSDWAYLGGVRFVQMAARHGLRRGTGPPSGLDSLREGTGRA